MRPIAIATGGYFTGTGIDPLSIATDGYLYTLRVQTEDVHHGSTAKQRKTWLQHQAERDRDMRSVIDREDEEIMLIIQTIMEYI